MKAHLLTAATNGIQLIDEKDCWRISSRQLEDLVQVSLATSYPHIQNVIDGDSDETGAALTRSGSGYEGFPTAWWAIHENASPDLFAIRPKQRRILERVDNIHLDVLFEFIQ